MDYSLMKIAGNSMKRSMNTFHTPAIIKKAGEVDA
jgi:hypothetical protein